MTCLYKYRSFGINTLRMLCESEVHYSDPAKFNDPLDCSPTVVVDISLDRLEELYLKMIGDAQAQNNLNRFRYYEDEDDTIHESTDARYQELIADRIKSQLDSEMKTRGVLSLARQWNSPLMWSHYSDEHKGVCIEYDVSSSVCDPPKKVDYEGNRGILASDIMSWVFDRAIAAKERIEHKYFYTKANQWRYEEEWRYIQDMQPGQERRRGAPFKIKGIHFGMRCERSVVTSIVQLMGGLTSGIIFYNVSTSATSFELIRNEIDAEQIDGYYKPMPSWSMAFGQLINHGDLDQ